MTVIAKITELDPRHGVLAKGNIIINSIIKIKNVLLLPNFKNGGYRIQFPSSEGIKSSCIEVNDEELKIKIVDAMTAQYHKRLNRKGKKFSNNNYKSNLELERIESKQLRDFKQNVLGIYRYK